MRILQLVHQYLPEYIGGTELYTHWITHRLAQKGHQVAVFYRRSGISTALEARQDNDEVQVWAVQSGLLSAQNRFTATFREAYITEAFKRVLAQFQPELVHIQHLMGLPANITAQLRYQGIPFIITLHDYWWVCANAQLVTNYNQQVCDGPQVYLNCARCALARSGRAGFLPALPALAGLMAWRNGRLRQVLQEAHTLIAPTQFTSNWYRNHGAPATKLRVIPHGLDLPPICSWREREKNSPFRFAFIGGLSWQKGVHILIEAFQGLERHAELWIAGDETADPAYVTGLRRLASPQIRFLGKLTREAVWQTLAQVDVIVVPALWYETFSFIISEAFAAGIPVVASRLGPLADRVQDGLNGLLVEPGNPAALRAALLRFYEEPDLWPHLQAGIRPVDTLDDYIIQLEAIYQAAKT
jgi:glycosyltransferase involved in cell wall biosynthesis